MFDEARSVAMDADGNVIVAGHTEGSLGGPNTGLTDVFVQKVDPDGNTLWTRQFGTISEDIAYGVATDSNGNAAVTGHTYGDLFGPNAGSIDAFLRVFTPDGG
ncbi:MAG TPA: SBBP repeat-containing protein [Chloroflexota bacterium]|nr:SBBP repeat-containing protein [Chloroflexota bacterium]HUM69131.1 SBBP repeat-containing protein [Chloroflexota bacterium]